MVCVFIFSHKERKVGGRFGLYIQLKFKLRTDLQSSDNAIYELVFVEIIQPRDVVSDE